MLRVGIENGRLCMMTESLTRDALDGRMQVPLRRATSRMEQRFEPIDDLVATLDLHAKAGVAV